MMKMQGQTTLEYPYTAFALVDYLEKFYRQSTFTLRY